VRTFYAAKPATSTIAIPDVTQRNPLFRLLKRASVQEKPVHLLV
jgi:hypothetical protein